MKQEKLFLNNVLRIHLIVKSFKEIVQANEYVMKLSKTETGIYERFI